VEIFLTIRIVFPIPLSKGRRIPHRDTLDNCNIHTDAAGCALGDTNCNLLCLAVRCLVLP